MRSSPYHVLLCLCNSFPPSYPQLILFKMLLDSHANMCMLECRFFFFFSFIFFLCVKKGRKKKRGLKYLFICLHSGGNHLDGCHLYCPRRCHMILISHFLVYCLSYGAHFSCSPISELELKITSWLTGSPNTIYMFVLLII